jgi:hypothetical protein
MILKGRKSIHLLKQDQSNCLQKSQIHNYWKKMPMHKKFLLSQSWICIKNKNNLSTKIWFKMILISKWVALNILKIFIMIKVLKQKNMLIYYTRFLESVISWWLTIRIIKTHWKTFKLSMKSSNYIGSLLKNIQRIIAYKFYIKI